MPTKLTPEIITAAIEGFKAEKTRIDQQIAELRAMLPSPLLLQPRQERPPASAGNSPLPLGKG